MGRRLLRDNCQHFAEKVVSGMSNVFLRTHAKEQGRGHHPRTIIEIATDVKLRDHFHLEDGDLVEIETFNE